MGNENVNEWQKGRIPLWVKHETQDRLKEIGKKEETYDSIINRILDNLEQKDVGEEL